MPIFTPLWRTAVPALGGNTCLDQFLHFNSCKVPWDHLVLMWLYTNEAEVDPLFLRLTLSLRWHPSELHRIYLVIMFIRHIQQSDFYCQLKQIVTTQGVLLVREMTSVSPRGVKLNSWQCWSGVRQNNFSTEKSLQCSSSCSSYHENDRTDKTASVLQHPR